MLGDSVYKGRVGHGSGRSVLPISTWNPCPCEALVDIHLFGGTPCIPLGCFISDLYYGTANPSTVIAALIYLDDILVYSKTEEEHYELLERVLQRLKEADLKAKLSKCHFFKDELNYLGHVVSRHGIKPDRTKVEAVENWPTPRSVHDVRSFLGLANYFRKFIQGYALLARPLTDLLKGLDKQERKGKTTVRPLKIPAGKIFLAWGDWRSRSTNSAGSYRRQAFETI